MGILLDCFTIDYMASTFHYSTYKATVSSYIPKNQSFYSSVECGFLSFISMKLNHIPELWKVKDNSITQ